MNILGVDQSYTGFGYAWKIRPGDSPRDIAVGIHKFPLSGYTSDIHRLAAIAKWFDAMLHHHGVSGMVMEGYASAAKFGREQAGELGGVVKLTAHRRGVEVISVAPPTLKKFVTGKGNAKKNEMLLGVYKRWGEEFSDDNKADAFALYMFGEAYWGSSDKLLKFQQEVIEKYRKDHPL